MTFEPPASPRPLGVVVVEDTDHVRRMLVDMLTLDGFEVLAHSGDGSAAADLVAQHRPDLVVMDLQMPGTDGLTATRAVREVAPSTPVVLFTAFVDQGVRQAAREAGASLVLSKVEGLPWLETELRRLVEDRAW